MFVASLRSSALSLTVAALAALSLSCASAYMRGSEPAASAPAAAQVGFTVSACTDMATQQPAPLPGVLQYWLVEEQGKPVLYEKDTGGNITRIFNHWVQDDGADVFFTWVARNSGWQYVIPQDRSGGVRFVYAHGRFKSFPDGDVSKVTGTATFLCVMTPL